MLLPLLLACATGDLGGAAPGELAPDFSLLSNSGATVTLSEHDDKVVLLDFSEFW